MGASADLEAIGAPSIFKLIRKAAALAMCFPCHFVIFFLFVFLIAQTQEAAVDDWRTSIIFYFYASIFFHFFPCCTNTGRGSGRLAYQHYFLFLYKYFFSFFFPVAQTQDAAVDDLAGFQLSDAEGMPSGFFFQVFFLCNYYFFPPTTWGACPSTEASYNSYFFIYFFNYFFLSIPRQRGADT
jgi:hypothetical protein